MFFADLRCPPFDRGEEFVILYSLSRGRQSCLWLERWVSVSEWAGGVAYQSRPQQHSTPNRVVCCRSWGLCCVSVSVGFRRGLVWRGWREGEVRETCVWWLVFGSEGSACLGLHPMRLISQGRDWGWIHYPLSTQPDYPFPYTASLSVCEVELGLGEA